MGHKYERLKAEIIYSTFYSGINILGRGSKEKTLRKTVLNEQKYCSLSLSIPLST